MEKDARDLKSQWKAEQRAPAKAAFPLPDNVLGDMFAAIEAKLATDGCDDTLRFTEAWLAEHGHPAGPVKAWLKENGGHCDCEVGANARQVWEENR